MENEKLEQLAWHIASHIGNSHNSNELPNRIILTHYIKEAIRTYETEHIDQKVMIVKNE